MFSAVLNSFDSPFDIDFFNLLFVYFKIKLKYSALCELYESVVIIVAVAVIAVIITIIFIIASNVNCFEKREVILSFMSWFQRGSHLNTSQGRIQDFP